MSSDVLTRYRPSPSPSRELAQRSSSSSSSAALVHALASQDGIPPIQNLKELHASLLSLRAETEQRSARLVKDQDDISKGRLPLSKARSISNVSASGSASKPKPKPGSLASPPSRVITPGPSASPAPVSAPPLAPLSASASQGVGTGSGANVGGKPRKSKVKREASTGAQSSGPRQGSEASPGLDSDMVWEDAPLARPGRTYNNKRGRLGTADSQDDSSTSEFASPQPPSSQKPGSQAQPQQDPQQVSHVQPQQQSSSTDSNVSARGLGSNLYAGPSSSTGPSSSNLGIKLKLNPTASTASQHQRRDSAASAHLRRGSTFRGDSPVASTPMTPAQASQAAMWELPKKTPETFVPKLAPTKPPRPYPTKQDDVDVDFAKMDWRERDKERDRLEAVAAAASGPGPGQAIVKETAVQRARDRKQEQVPHHTFQSWVDAYFRTMTEEDLAWLSSKSEDMEPFQIPPLGRHYSEVWEEEDTSSASAAALGYPPTPGSSTFSTLGASSVRPGANGVGTSAAGSVGPNGVHAKSRSGLNQLAIEPAPKFDPRHMRDEHVFGTAQEDARGGPFTERLIAALLPTSVSTSSGNGGAHGSDLSSNGVAMDMGNSSAGGLVLNGHHGEGGEGASRSQDMAEFEERIRRELKALDVVPATGSLTGVVGTGTGDADVDWSNRTDDEISSTLRQVQRALRRQMRINELRKSRLFKIAHDRLAWQDYMTALNTTEREIEQGWMKRQAQIRKSLQAQKKKKGGAGHSGGAPSSSSSGPPGSSSATNSLVAAATAAASSGPGTPGGAPSSDLAHDASMPASVGTPGGSTTETRHAGPIRPQFSEQLITAMKRRTKLHDGLYPLMRHLPHAFKTPTNSDESVYRDLDLSGE
ncbi:hypothetical protein FA10DRAFT_304354 [Acaromyces ingoldii]|uniref:Uncharacterized protein n=1 Tax=Acaromyces ingoldii TaxID=215250 RepID=A0A316YIQ8_9BASI|nr:hypothetical protein FA10DRAFT_304354 [Acaromyces ingoldii]PWN87595.1 hypothetical protein FA10DRAFT_304354 [Acaromyces ingoldii]